MQVTVYAKVENIGWVPQYFDLVGGPENASPADFTLTVDQRGQKSEKSITAVEPIPGGIRVVPEEFSYNQEFTLTGSGAAEGVSLTKKDVSNVEVEGMDKFVPLEENGIHYRLYSPKAGGPRPLILFLHGGGESGSDNFMQMVGTVGAIRLAELYPEMYVMAPQAPAGKLPIGLPSAQTFAGSVQDPDSGWNRSYLAGVCDLIRKMIAEGQVDASRVYVTGMSMGGGGTLRALSVGSGLFAAAVPICPTMPKAGGPRPLILFLHGGGESGSDNFMQMVGTVGAIRLAELYPEMYVMAPQAPAGKLPIGLPSAQTFAGSVQDPDSGWNRSYLAGVCDLIRKMIAEGQVDASRVYVTGMSMGGGGTLRALSVGSGLFAAAVPICPTMTPETFNILKSLVDTKIWVAAAYVDHTIYRHKYIVDGILAIKDAGNPDAHLTIFSPEELAEYGMGVDPQMPLVQRFSENHGCWSLVYSGEKGILDWMVTQHQ